jgi:hypothetical protein
VGRTLAALSAALAGLVALLLGLSFAVRHRADDSTRLVTKLRIVVVVYQVGSGPQADEHSKHPWWLRFAPLAQILGSFNEAFEAVSANVLEKFVSSQVMGAGEARVVTV